MRVYTALGLATILASGCSETSGIASDPTNTGVQNTSGTVLPPVTDVVIQPPASPLVLAGSELSLQATQNSGGTQTVADNVAWSSSATDIATVDRTTGVVQAIAEGDVYIRAITGQAPRDSVALRVITLSSFAISPAAPSVKVGASVQLATTLSSSVSWTSSNAAVAAVSATGVVTGRRAGLAIVTARNPQGRTAYAAVTVTNASPASPALPPAVVSMIINPKAITLASGATQQFAVSGSWSDGSTAAPAVSYSATGGSVSSTGLYTAGSTPGVYRVIATLQDGKKADTSTVTIAAPAVVLLHLLLTPASATVAPGATQQFAVAGSWSDGSTAAPAVSYTATGGTITASGLYSAGSTPGTYRVIAIQVASGKADTAAVVVPAPVTLTAVAISPKTITLTSGGAQQFSSTGVWSNGTKTAQPVNYSATGGTISSSGLYTASTTPGTFHVIATQQGGTKADTATVTVAAPVPTLVQITLTPASATVTPGATQQFAVAGKWSDGSTTAPAVSYAATGGTITAGGLYSAGSTPGTYRVVVGSGARSDTSSVTITPPATPCQAIPHQRLISVSTSSQLVAALGAAVAGDLIQLADGTYGGTQEFRIRSISGTPNNRITLCGSSNAVIDAHSKTDTDGLSVVDANYWTFVGFTITDALFGFYAEHASNNLLKDLTIHAIGQEAILIRAFSKKNVIQNNRIYDTGLSVAEYGEGVYIGTSQDAWCTYTGCAPDASDSTLIDGNTIGPNVRAEHIDVKDGSTGGEIRNNVMDGHGMVMSQSNWPASWVIIQGNGYNIHNNSGTFTLISGYRTVVHYTGWGMNNIFSSNTANVGGASYGFDIQAPASYGNIVKCNNTVAGASVSFASVACTP